MLYISKHYRFLMSLMVVMAIWAGSAVLAQAQCPGGICGLNPAAAKRVGPRRRTLSRVPVLKRLLCR